MHKVYLSAGSNIGDRIGYLRRAVDMLTERAGLRDVRISGVYETEPVGYDDQPYFLNICIEALTGTGMYELLAIIHDIERELHRERNIRFGPRTIDVDILLYDDVVSDDPVLTLPHPRMYERAFVLMPLSELKELPEGLTIPDDKSVVRLGDYTGFEV